MKVVMIIGYLVGSIFSLTGDFGEGTGGIEGTNIMTTAYVTPSTETIEMKQSRQQFKLQTVNGISLYDDPSSVIAKIGEPDFVTEDEYFKGVIIFHYPGMNVIFSDNILDYVEVLEGATTLLIDDIPVPATVENLKAALGEPDYITEDGIVFERDQALLKIFIDADSNKLKSITYFHRGME
ncbi:hypothetical protein [Cohnella soli]|uniref:DUF4309 domain-containing protein n=1 Tax=Cohnella soli TaxID=425005 RepID=A0ABW0HWI8_9BACL